MYIFDHPRIQPVTVAGNILSIIQRQIDGADGAAYLSDFILLTRTIGWDGRLHSYDLFPREQDPAVAAVMLTDAYLGLQ